MPLPPAIDGGQWGSYDTAPGVPGALSGRYWVTLIVRLIGIWPPGAAYRNP